MRGDQCAPRIGGQFSPRVNNIPNFGAVRRLMQAVGDDKGTVLHWWDHERTVLTEVRTQLSALPPDAIPDRDQLIGFINVLLGTKDEPGRLFDLGRLIHRTTFLPRTRGSSSLKKVLPALLATSQRLRRRYSEPTYGSPGGVPSLNFTGQAWVRIAADGSVIDPYSLLGERIDDPELAGLESREDDESAIADGGAAMVAYGLLQSGLLDEPSRRQVHSQLLRYCELDTLAMVMAWEGICEHLDEAVEPAVE